MASQEGDPMPIQDATRELPIPGALAACKHSIDILKDALRDLTDRLAPVLSPNLPILEVNRGEKEVRMPSQEYMSLAGEIQMMADKLAIQHQIVRELLSRLEL